MPATALIYWGGVDITAGWSFTFSPGIYPSQCIIDSPPHSASLADYGDLVIAYGDSGDGGGRSTQLVFTDCILERPTLRSSGVKMWQLPIQDRRWKWRGGHITGEYNKQKPDGTYIREQEPQQLATKLLQAMGESDYGFDVSRLPNDSRPYRKWDYSNPAAELQSLCDELGCIVVLNPLVNKVELWPIGEGPELPGGVTIGGSIPIDQLQKPEVIKVVTQPVIFEASFVLGEAVGFDIDGKVKPINELSYTPTIGWGAVAEYDDIPGTYVDASGVTQKYAELAESCIWRFYRITGCTTGGWHPRQFEQMPMPQSIEEITLLPNRIVVVEQPDGALRPLPAMCEIWRYEEGEFGVTQEIYKPIIEGFSIDPTRGIVGFSQPSYRLVDGVKLPAFGYLTTSYSVKSEGVPHRWAKGFDVGGRGGELIVPATGVARKVIYRHVFNEQLGFWQVNTADNYDSVIGEVTRVAQLALREFERSGAASLNYPGINPISPNGKVAQVTWSKQAAGPIITTASLNREHNAYLPRAKENRARAKRERIEAGFEAVNPASRAINQVEAAVA